MSGCKHARMDVAERRQQVFDLHLQGFSQNAIAAHLNVSQTTVHFDLWAVWKERRAAQIRNIEVLRERELEKLNLLERIEWAAWQRSGDLRYLKLLTDAVVQRREMLGLEAPPPSPKEIPLILDSRENRLIRLEKIFQSLRQNSAKRKPPRSEPEGM